MLIFLMLSNHFSSIFWTETSPASEGMKQLSKDKLGAFSCPKLTKNKITEALHRIRNGRLVSCPHQRLLEVKQLQETVCTGADALLLLEALSISLSVLWNSSGRHSAYLHLHIGSCLGLNWRSCRHPTFTEGHGRCQGQLSIAA